MLKRIPWRITAPPVRGRQQQQQQQQSPSHSAAALQLPPPPPASSDEYDAEYYASSSRHPGPPRPLPSSSSRLPLAGFGLRQTSVLREPQSSDPFFTPTRTRPQNDARPQRHRDKRQRQRDIVVLRQALQDTVLKNINTVAGYQDLLLSRYPELEHILHQPTVLEQHTILHDLLRKGKIDVATDILLRLLANLPPDRPPRFRQLSLQALVRDRPEHRRYRPLRTFTKVYSREGQPMPQPAIADQAPPRLYKELSDFLAVIRTLQTIHHPRPELVYHIAIQEAIGAGRPDVAAEVFVELVEEWIMEGRLAEGAVAEDFYRSGKIGAPAGQWDQAVPAPPKGPEAQLRRGLLNSWFSGVRTWRLPGEALSLHQRLDLWHPRGHAPDEKMRGFPMPVPTSPPSKVPAPSRNLLQPILDAIYLDPTECTNIEFATSMRALGTLANTILSRTLPLPAIPGLLKLFSRSERHPVVYPAFMEDVPAKDAWSYTSSNQVHNALMSLMFSPPNYAAAARMETKFAIEDNLPRSEGAAQYALQALGWQSCMVLIHYALVKIQQPTILTRLINYMTSMFTWTSAEPINRLLSNSKVAHTPWLIKILEDKLFPKNSAVASTQRWGRAKTSLLPEDGKIEPLSSILHAQPGRIPPAPGSPEEMVWFASHEAFAQALADLPDMDADARSCTALLVHLMNSGQYKRLHKVVVNLVPFFKVNKQTPIAVIDALAEQGAEVGRSGRIRSVHLTPEMYTVILSACLRSRDVWFAARIFESALFHGRRTFFQRLRHHTNKNLDGAVGKHSKRARLNIAPEPLHARLSITAYTTMLSIYGLEANSDGPLRDWFFPARFHKHQPEDCSTAGHIMGWDTYLRARNMWCQVIESGFDDPIVPHYMPGVDFFTAAIGTFFRGWTLDKPDEPLTPAAREELKMVLADMAYFELDLPAGLVAKLTGAPLPTDEGQFFPPPREKAAVTFYWKDTTDAMVRSHPAEGEGSAFAEIPDPENGNAAATGYMTLRGGQYGHTMTRTTYNPRHRPPWVERGLDDPKASVNRYIRNPQDEGEERETKETQEEEDDDDMENLTEEERAEQAETERVYEEAKEAARRAAAKVRAVAWQEAEAEAEAARRAEQQRYDKDKGDLRMHYNQHNPRRAK